MSRTTIRKFQKREIILHQGACERCLYKVLSGMVGIYKDYGRPDEQLVEILNSPGCFGELMLLAGRPSDHAAVAFSDAVVLHVPEDALETFIRSDARNAVNIMKAMAEKLSQMHDRTDGAGLSAAPHQADASAVKDKPALEKGKSALEEDTPAPEEKAAVPASEEAPPEDRQEQPPEAAVQEADGGASEDEAAYEGLYLPGHKGYPGVTHPEYKTHLFDKDYTCPNCRHRFAGVRIFYPKLVAANNPESMRYNLRIFYKDFEAEWYEVVTCPSCCFSTLDSFFAGGKTLHKKRFEQQLSLAREEVWMDFLAERDLDFVFSQHYLALACARGYTDYRQISAHLWINLSWLYRSVREPELVRLAEERAAEAYQSVYTNCALEPAQEQHLCLTIADILYRGGDGKKAREWALKARLNRIGKPAYSNLAEQIIEDIRAEMTKNGTP